MKLIAAELGLSEEDNTVILVIRGNNETNYLILSQLLDELEIDGKTLYIEINSQAFGGYNLIKELTVESQKLEIILNEEGINILRLKKIEVEFMNVDFNIEYLKLALRKIFKDSQILKIEN